MFEDLDGTDVVECPAAGCDYRAPVDLLVPHLIGAEDPAHRRILETEDVPTDRY